MFKSSIMAALVVVLTASSAWAFGYPYYYGRGPVVYPPIYTNAIQLPNMPNYSAYQYGYGYSRYGYPSYGYSVPYRVPSYRRTYVPSTPPGALPSVHRRGIGFDAGYGAASR